MCLGWIHKCGWAPLPRKVAFKDDHFTFLGASEMRSWQLRTSGRFQVRLQVSYALPVTMIKMVGVGYMAKGTDRWQERQTVICCCCSVTKSGPFFRDPMGCMDRLPYPSLSPGVCSNSCILNWWCHPTISSSVSPSPPAFSLSQQQILFQWVSSLHQVANVLELQLQHQSFQWTMGPLILELNPTLLWSRSFHGPYTYKELHKSLSCLSENP